MTYGIALNSSLSNQTPSRPSITSYDSEYEHSVNHYVDVKLLLQDADTEANEVPASFAAAS